MSGGDPPVELIDGPASRRLLAQLAEDRWRRRPPESFDPHSVVLAIAGDAAEPLAKRLAVESGREYLALDDPALALAMARTRCASLVSVAGNLSEELVVAAARAGRLGLVTARSLAQLSALVARTLLDPIDRADPPVFVDLLSSATPGSPAITTMHSLEAALRYGAEFVGLRGHGRACMVHLADGVVCGREEPPAMGPSNSPGAAALSCLHGEGCVRSHWSGPKLMQGRRLKASVVLLDSCQMLPFSATQPESASLVLSILDGEAVAVLASPWAREAPRLHTRAAPVALAHGLSLGDTVALLNEAVRLSPQSFGEYTLLGDAGLRPRPDGAGPVPIAAGLTVRATSAGTMIRLTDSGSPRITVTGGTALRVGAADYMLWPPDGSPRADITVSTAVDLSAALDALAGDLAAIAGWAAYDLAPAPADLNRLRAQTMRAFRRCGASEPDLELHTEYLRLSQARDEFVRGAAESLLHRTVSSFFRLTDAYVPASMRDGESNASCPECDRPARCYQWRHISSGVRRRVCICFVCGDVSDSEPDSVDLRVRGPSTVARQARLQQEVTLTGRDGSAASGWLACGLMNGEVYGETMSTLLPFSLDQGESQEFVLEHAIPQDFDPADHHVVRFFALTRRSLTVRNRPVWVTP